MYQKEAAKAAWTAAGLYRSRDPNLRAFLKHIDTAAPDCWVKLAEKLRAEHPQLLEPIVAPLWNSGDKLLRVNIVRHLDPSRKDEHDLLDRLARKLDAKDDGPELVAIARSGTTKAIDRIAKRSDVPEPIRGLARQRLVVLAQEAADAAAIARAEAPPVPAPQANPVAAEPPQPAGGTKRGKSARTKGARRR